VNIGDNQQQQNSAYQSNQLQNALQQQQQLQQPHFSEANRSRSVGRINQPALQVHPAFTRTQPFVRNPTQQPQMNNLAQATTNHIGYVSDVGSDGSVSLHSTQSERMRQQQQQRQQPQQQPQQQQMNMAGHSSTSYPQQSQQAPMTHTPAPTTMTQHNQQYQQQQLQQQARLGAGEEETHGACRHS
jgi:hypothetical protein